VRVRLADGRELAADVRGIDERLDVAVLEIEGATNLPFASLGSSEAVRVGEYVVAIGNPFGLGDTVTHGIVSAKGRAIGAGPYDDFLQTDASINPGNSGGPLFNLLGQVVGINTAIASEGKGIGFAIPIDDVKAVLPQLLATGRVERGKLGVIIQPVDAPLAKALELPRAAGALVNEVEPGGPAAKARIEVGDVIVAVDGAPVEAANDLPRMIARHKPGSTVRLEVASRGAGRRTVSVVLDALEAKRPAPQPTATPSRAPDRGFGVSLADHPRGGVVVRDVDEGGPAGGVLERGDVIVEIDGVRVKNARDAAERMREVSGRPVLLRVMRGGQSRFVAIERP
jgi:serine protease Do